MVTAPLAEAIERAFREFDHPDDIPDDLAAAARIELIHLWHDLSVGRQQAANGVWSMGCDNTLYRIVLLSRLAGATSWRDVPVVLIVDGVYQQLYEQAGIPYEPIDMDRARETHERNHAGPARERPVTEDMARFLGRSDLAGGTLILPVCPTCGEVIEGHGMHRDVIEIWGDLEPLWPDGPLVTVPTLAPRLVPGKATWTVWPCGHLVDASDLTIEMRGPGGADA